MDIFKENVRGYFSFKKIHLEKILKNVELLFGMLSISSKCWLGGLICMGKAATRCSSSRTSMMIFIFTKIIFV
jgi:hypothetical protein